MQEAKKPSILVTGAAGGTQGATGRVLAERLLKRGVTVRALVRTDDERAASLRAAGAEVRLAFFSMHRCFEVSEAHMYLQSLRWETPFALERTVLLLCPQQEMLLQVVVGDLLKIEDVARAAQGVDYMFFTFAVQRGLLEASTIAAIAARDAGKCHHAHHCLCTLSDILRGPHLFKDARVTLPNWAANESRPPLFNAAGCIEDISHHHMRQEGPSFRSLLNALTQRKANARVASHS